MANQGNTKGFIENSTVRVFKDTGVRDMKNGISTSERTGGDYPDITSDEDLLVLKKFGSTRALVRRENGQEVNIHINHVTPASTYYSQRGQKKPKASTKITAEMEQKVRSDLDAAVAKLNSANAAVSADEDDSDEEFDLDSLDEAAEG